MTTRSGTARTRNVFLTFLRWGRGVQPRPTAALKGSPHTHLKPIYCDDRQALDVQAAATRCRWIGGGSGGRRRCGRSVRARRRIGGAAVARPEHFPEFLSRNAGDISNVGESLRRRDERTGGWHVACLR